LIQWAKTCWQHWKSSFNAFFCKSIQFAITKAHLAPYPSPPITDIIYDITKVTLSGWLSCGRQKSWPLLNRGKRLFYYQLLVTCQNAVIELLGFPWLLLFMHSIAVVIEKSGPTLLTTYMHSKLLEWATKWF
jgi:hypothetical protein